MPMGWRTIKKLISGSRVWGGSGTPEDYQVFGDTDGAYGKWDASEDKLEFVKSSLKFSGAQDGTEHLIEVTATGLSGKRVLCFGAWGTELESSGLERIYWTPLTGGGTQTMRFVRAVAKGEDGAIGCQYYADSDAPTPGPTSLSAADFFAVVNAGKYIAASVGATDGMHATWHKVQADVSSVINGNVYAIWVDNQIHCAVGGVEYGVFCTTGGSRPNGLLGLNTSSSGYDNLIYCDATFNSGAGTCFQTSAVPATQDARIKVYYDGAQYYLALYK